MANDNLGAAKKAKNDEFYTQYEDIEKEMNAYLDFNADVFRGMTVLLPCDDPEWSNFTKYFAQNFEKLGLKKLISTSYAPNSKNLDDLFAPTDFESSSDKYDKSKSESNGRIFTLTRDTNRDKRIDFKDIEWEYLQGDGDFRSKELLDLRHEADVVITNPPFSLFRQFLSWIVEGKNKFVIIGNMNAITYKEAFPLIKEDKIWVGATNFNAGMYFRVPEGFSYASTYKFERERNGEKVNRVPGVCWFTNLEHGRRHQPLPLMTMADNIKFSKHKEIKDIGYQTFENFDAIEVPFTDAIPSDFKGIMGVPISFLDKYNPDQFEILGNGQSMASELGIKPVGQNFVDDYYAQGNKGQINASWNNLVYRLGQKTVVPYQRILIRHRKR